MPPLLVVAAMTAVMFRPIGGRGGTIAIVLLSAILIACLKKGTAAYQFFTLEKIVYVGLISYSLYLWHWTVLSISRWTIGIYWWSVPFQVGLMMLAAIGSYKYIEQPAKTGGKNAGRKITFIAGLSIAIASLLLARGIASQSRYMYQVANPQVKWYEKKFPGGRVYKTWILAETKSSVPDAELNKTASSRGCMTTGFVTREDLQKCLGAGIPSNNSRGRIFIIGDSHAYAYSPGIKYAFSNWDVRTYTVGWGCSYLPHSTAITNGKRFYFNCLDYVENIDAFVESYLRPNDMVVLGMDWRDTGGKKGTPGLAKVIASLASRVTSGGASFVLLDDVPELGEPLVCQKTWYRPFPPSKCVKSLEEVGRDQTSLDQIGRQVDSLSEKSKYVSLRTDLCDKERQCSIYLDGMQIFRDNGHITEDAAIRYTSETFKRELSPLFE